MIIGYKLKDSKGNPPEVFTHFEMFESLSDAESWISVNDGDWTIVPVTKEEMKEKTHYYSALEDDMIDWDKEWNHFIDDQLPD